MAHEAIRAARHELRLVLLRHRGAPVAPDVDARPDREAQAEGEEDEPDAGQPRIGVDAVAAKRSEPNEEAGDRRDHHPDPELARPRDAASLHGEGRYQPVQPEGRPADG